MSPTLWFLLLTTAAFLLFALEVFIPDLILAAAGVLCLVGACVVAFQAFPPQTAAWISMGLVAATLTAFMVWLVKIPDSRAGKRISLNSNLQDAKSSIDESPFLGKRGTAETDLRPGGFARIDGQRMDVLCNRGYVEKGSEIEVVEARGNHIVVREIPKDVT
ncbi:MAG: NfeD family protein [Verrucomicrobia bacterium]|nr:NfeD family protein [Verrucomicrobiota bacterium]MCH8512743.1 hypothetical protein [Kiritimatiellia bacterium]